MRDRIAIRRKTTTKNPTTGAPSETWANLAGADNIYAEVVSLNGRESVIGSVLQGISYFQITIRYRRDILPSDQIIWLTSDDRELNIHSAEDRLGTRQWTTIQASTQAPQQAGE
jgi:SPP1 family predicted phage head-tail adaptor